MKKAFLFLSILILASMACDMSVAVASPTSPAPLPTDTMIAVTEVPTLVPASPTSIPATATVADTAVPAVTGVEVSFDPLHIVLSPDIASGASGVQVPRAEGGDFPTWGVTPGHVEISLEGYLLQNKFHKPKIYVYPALAYAEMVPAAFESIHRLDNILYPPGGPNLNNPLPIVPFFNAAQAFASNIELVSFQNGQGVRFLTEYSQYAASANNTDLFYMFQGLTRDGAYYVIAIFPITAPVLAETSDAGAPLPPGGIPYPYYSDPNADMPAYYTAVTSLLNSASPDSFTPTLTQLDQLIASMRIGS